MKIKYLLLFLFSAPLFAYTQDNKLNQPLVDSLAKWVILDQTAAGPPKGRFKEMAREDKQRYSDSIFITNERRLIAVFNKYGYPGYDLVGKTGSNNFWLMVQHCDKNVSFQQTVLKKMKAEVAKRNADPKNFAYLTDRVLLNTSQKQFYGTQVTYNTDSCQAIPKPLKDSISVNKRRTEIGLETIENYLNLMSQWHFDMNKEVYERKGIHQPKLLTEPKQ